MDWGNSLHVECKASRKPSNHCWLGWIEFTVITLVRAYFSSSSHAWSGTILVNSRQQERQKAEGIVCCYFFFFFPKKKIEVSWIYNSLMIGPDAHTWASVLFSLRTELSCCFGCGWKMNRESLWREALICDCVWKHWTLKELPPMHWDWLPLPWLGLLCGNMLLLSARARHFQEDKIALCGDV